MADLRLGDYRDVLADVECDAVITDPPFGARTHEANVYADRTNRGDDGSDRRSILYDAWTADDARAFVEFWHERCRGWIVIMSCHELQRHYEAALMDAGRYVSAPVPATNYGGGMRVCGGGPPSWTVWVTVARPRSREFAAWGTVARPDTVFPQGAYRVPGGRSHQSHVAGGKSIRTMREIVRDYSCAGDLVCDPCAGGGTTLSAALLEGREVVGAEIDPERHAQALATLRGDLVTHGAADRQLGLRL